MNAFFQDVRNIIFWGQVIWKMLNETVSLVFCVEYLIMNVVVPVVLSS